MSVGGFYQIPVKLFRATRVFTTDESSSYPIGCYDKMVYVHMRNRFVYYDNNHLEYSESLESIAKACGFGRSSVVKSINNWCNMGVIAKLTTRDEKGVRHTKYQVKDLTFFILK